MSAIRDKAEVARTSPNGREDGGVSGAVLAGCEPVVKVVKPHEARSEFNFSRAVIASASFWVLSEASVAPRTFLDLGLDLINQGLRFRCAYFEG